MRSHATTILACLTVVSALEAQSALNRNFRFDFTAGGGRVRHETDSSSLDGRTDGGFARVRFEGVSNQGIGGGVRFESWGSDDDLFVDEGFTAEEATARAIFGHFTYRAGGRGKFIMPIRIGLMAHNYELENVASGASTLEVDSFGPRFEVEPEFIFNRGRAVEVSAYGVFGLAGTFSTAEISTSSSDFDSGSAFWFLEAGARVRFKFFELGTGIVTNGMAMAESDTVGTTVVNGFGSSFTGIIFTGAFVF